MTNVRTDRATYHVSAPPSAVYRAMIDPEALVQWLPPRGMTGQISVHEPRPGGRFEMTLTYDQADVTGRRPATAMSCKPSSLR